MGRQKKKKEKTQTTQGHREPRKGVRETRNGNGETAFRLCDASRRFSFSTITVNAAVNILSRRYIKDPVAYPLVSCVKLFHTVAWSHSRSSLPESGARSRTGSFVVREGGF